MIFVPGLRGRHVPKAVVQVQCRGIECVSAKQQEMRRVRLRSRQRETDRRISCATNSPAPVSNSQQCLFFLWALDFRKKSHWWVTPATFITILISWFIKCHQTRTWTPQMCTKCYSVESFITITIQNVVFLRPYCRLMFSPWMYSRNKWSQILSQSLMNEQVKPSFTAILQSHASNSDSAHFCCRPRKVKEVNRINV